MKLKCQKFLDCHDWIKPRKQIDMLLGKCLLIKFTYNLFFNWKKKTENKMFTDYEQKVNNLIKENITKFLSPLKMKWGKSESDHIVFSK